jgi:hypothetical protein
MVEAVPELRATSAAGPYGWPLSAVDVVADINVTEANHHQVRVYDREVSDL